VYKYRPKDGRKDGLKDGPHMKKAVMLFKGSKGAQFLFTAKYQNN
jgi:hypothetical protein